MKFITHGHDLLDLVRCVIDVMPDMIQLLISFSWEHP